MWINPSFHGNCWANDPRKRKASFSVGAHDAEDGCSAANDPSIRPFKKRKRSKLIFDLNDLAITWSVTVILEKKEAINEECISTKPAQALASTNESVGVQSSNDQVNKV